MSLFSITANRASAILYSFLKEYGKGVWLLPVNVCPDVPFTFCAASIQFEFVDINSETLCMDENACLTILQTKKTKYRGIIFVRTYGFLYDTRQFFDVCRSIVPDLLIVDDRCLCLPSFNPVTYGADLLLYSTGHCKQIDLGGGGFAFSNKEFSLIANHAYDGMNEEAIYKQAYKDDRLLDDIPIGWLEVTNYKNIDLYKEIVSTLLPKRIEQRDTINDIYRNNIALRYQYSIDFQNWRFNLKVSINQKQVILDRLFCSGLFASNHYRCANRLFDRENFCEATRVFNTTLNLFNDYNYTTDMAEKTSIIINSVLLDK